MYFRIVGPAVKHVDLWFRDGWMIGAAPRGNAFQGRLDGPLFDNREYGQSVDLFRRQRVPRVAQFAIAFELDKQRLCRIEMI